MIPVSGLKHKGHSVNDHCFGCQTMHVGGRCHRYEEWVGPHSCRHATPRNLTDVRGS